MNPRRRDVPPLVLLVLIGTQRPSFSLPFFLALNHSRGKIAAVDEEASGWGFRPLCGDNSSYTRYPGKGLPDEILEEKARSLALSFFLGPFSSLATLGVVREKTQHGSRLVGSWPKHLIGRVHLCLSS